MTFDEKAKQLGITDLIENIEAAGTHELYWNCKLAASEGLHREALILFNAYQDRGLVAHWQRDGETLANGQKRIHYYWVVDVSKLGWVHDDGGHYIADIRTLYHGVAWVQDWEGLQPGDQEPVGGFTDWRWFGIPSATRPDEHGRVIVQQFVTTGYPGPEPDNDSPAAIEAAYIDQGLGHVVN